MRIKTDFTTNSSSSSFVILSKKEYTIGELGVLIEEIIGLKDNPVSLFPTLSTDVKESIVGCIYGEGEEDYLEDVGYDSWDEYFDDEWSNLFTKEDLKEYPIIVYGSMTNETDDPIEQLLCETAINFKNDNIMIKKDGGF